MNGPQIVEHSACSLHYTPFEIKWIPASTKLVVCGVNPKSDGILNVLQVNNGKLNSLIKIDKKEGIKCATFDASFYENRHLATGSFEGTLNIWDLESAKQPIYNVKAHKNIINCIAGIGGLNVGYGAPEIATGSRDGCVKIWDPRQTDHVASLEPGDDNIRDCWSVCFGNTFDEHERIVAAGYDNGDLKLLDLRMNKLIFETNVKNGIVGVQFDRPDIKMNKLIVTSLESKFRLFDMRTKHPKLDYAYSSIKAHKSTIWKGVFLPQNRDIFMTTGGNGSLNLYKYSYPEKRFILDSDGFAKGIMGETTLLNSQRISDQPIVSFDWNRDKMGLAACISLDQQARILFSVGI